MSDNFKKIFPHVAAIVLFLGLTMTYFYPIITENKQLDQPDLSQMIGWGKDLKDYHEETGDYAFWSNTMFSGMPANYTYIPPFPNIFNYLRDVFVFKLSFNHLGVFFVYLLGFYIFLISIGCKPLLSFVGSIAYAFASYNLIIIQVGHVNKGLAMATMAPIIGGIILCYRKKILWGSIITLVFTGINIVFAHQQISYYLLLVIIILAIVYFVYAINEKMIKDYLKSSIVLLFVAALAIAPNAGSLLTTLDYSKETMRGDAVLRNETGKEKSGLDIDYAFAWSYGIGETMTLLIPNFYGSSTHYNIGENSELYNLIKKSGYSNQAASQQSKNAPMYWGGKSSTAGPNYAGAIVCFLFVLGLFIVKGPEKWWLLAATILSIVLAWGKNFAFVNNFLFYHLPLYNKFRTPEMALIIAGFTLVTLAILALKEIFDNKGDRKIFLKPMYISAGITGGLCLIFALFGDGLRSFSGPNDAYIIQNPEMLAAIVSDRKSMLASDSWRSFVLIALAAGAIWYFLNKKIKTTYIIALLGVLIFIDLWPVCKRFLNYDNFITKKVTPTEVDRQILMDKDPNYRVLNLVYGIGSAFNESTTSYFHKSIGGYSPAKLQRYQDIIDHHFGRGLNINVLNMLNTKYVIQLDRQSGQQGVQINQGALGNAWFVNELKWVDSPDEEIAALNDFNPLQTAFIDKEWQSSLKGWEALQHETADSTAYIRLTDYANPGNLFYESSSSNPCLAVFSEVYFKTWRAYIDGVEAPLVRVNYILRGLQVPAGNHKIEFRCVDEVYLRGVKISRIASIFVGIILLSMVGFACRTVISKKEGVVINKGLTKKRS